MTRHATQEERWDRDRDLRKHETPVRRMPPGVCVYCDANRSDAMMPSHTPSERCESGKRPHCTCDTCF